MQEFYLEIKDRLGVENVAADHLSMLSTHIFTPILDSFPNENILEIEANSLPWYEHIVKCLMTGKIPKDWDFDDREEFFKDLPFYFYNELELFHRGVDHTYRCYVLKEEP